MYQTFSRGRNDVRNKFLFYYLDIESIQCMSDTLILTHLLLMDMDYSSLVRMIQVLMVQGAERSPKELEYGMSVWMCICPSMCKLECVLER